MITSAKVNTEVSVWRLHFWAEQLKQVWRGPVGVAHHRLLKSVDHLGQVETLGDFTASTNPAATVTLFLLGAGATAATLTVTVFLRGVGAAATTTFAGTTICVTNDGNSGAVVARLSAQGYSESL